MNTAPYRGRLRQHARPDRRSLTGSTAVLVSGPLGALQLYLRRGPGSLCCIGPVTTPRQLTDDLCRLPPPCIVVLCGTRHLRPIAEQVLQRTDLYIVPACWLASVPASDPAGRAALAVRLVNAHRRAPIECLVHPDQLYFPF